jgi:hypothetical protein
MKPKQINVVVVEPHKAPYIKAIENTLQAQQKIVGGYIEPIDIAYDSETGRKVSFVVNEEGKLNGLPDNRTMIIPRNDGAFMDMIVGTFYVNAWDDEGESVGLTESELEEYSEFFRPFAFLLK